MSVFGDLSELAGTLDSAGAVAYARGAIIQAGVLGGASANATLSALRDAGVGFNRANFLQTWREAQDQLGPAQRAGSLPLDASTGQIVPGEPPGDWTGQMVHQVTATWRTKETDGTWSIHSKPYGIIDTAWLTPAQAAQSALDMINTPMSSDEAERYPSGGDILSLTLTGGWYRTNPNWSAGL